MTSTDFYALAGGFEPKKLDLAGSVLPGHVLQRMEDAAREEYRLFIEDSPSFVAECRSCGTPLAAEFDGLCEQDRRDRVYDMATFTGFLLSKGYVLMPLPVMDITRSETDVMNAITDLAVALHGNWAFELKSRGAVMGIDVVTEDGRVVMHSGLLPFEYLGFYDPDEVRPEILEQRRGERDRAQAPFLDKARWVVYALETQFCFRHRRLDP